MVNILSVVNYHTSLHIDLAYLPEVEELILSEQEFEETQTMSSPETSIPTISEDIGM